MSRVRALVVSAVLLGGASFTRGAEPAEEPLTGSKTELGFVPLVGGDTDIGAGVGFLGSLARVAPQVRPFVWRVEAAAFFSFKLRDGGLVAPYQDAFAAITLPGLANGRLRLELRPSFTRENNLRYFGLGNAAPAPDDVEPARDYYKRTRPALWVRARVAAGAGFHGLVGAAYLQNWIDYEPQSTLARDQREGAPDVQSLLHVDRRHGLLLTEFGVAYDSRDDEIAPSRGQHHHVKLRVSPGSAGPLPYTYAQSNLTTRFYLPLLGSRLVLATRQIVDLLFGDVPFYELSRFEEASALGGANGVRGVPGDRYYGKVKLFGNVELRWAAWRFQLRGRPYQLGVVGFADAGRLWSDFSPSRELDGTGLGLKYGVGGGVRVQKESTFVLRIDAAWSPDARPVGAYFLAGHLF